MRAFPLVALLALSGCLSGPTASGDDPVCGGTLHGLDLQAATIPDLQAALTAGDLTSAELVEAYLARIAAFDDEGPAVNAIRELNPTALQQAAALDAERAAGHVRGPLHGIPILLKDNTGTSDQHTTAGSIALADNVPPEDAAIVARLREAGAIILGKTELSEFANWVSLTMPNGYSSLGGQVVNAYTGGDPSGSSSGSGVAGSMAYSAGTFGSETSGSILSPSNANSLVGVKPTTGLLSRTGIIPLAESFDTAGPMVRNVVDAALLLDAVAGSDPRDARTANADAHLPPDGYAAALDGTALQGVRIGYRDNSNILFQDALAVLEAQGAVLVPIDDSALQQSSILELPLIFNEFKAGINGYLADTAGPGLPVSDLTGIILYNNDHPDQVQYGQDLLIASDATPGVAPTIPVAALPVITAAQTAADDAFADVAAIVGLDAPYTSLGAAAGYPTVTVPAGYTGTEPHGLSFFGPAWSEADLLGFAYAYEQASHLRRPPATVNPGLVGDVCAA